MVFRKSEKRIKEQGKPKNRPSPPRNFEKHRNKVVSTHGNEVGTSRRDLEEETKKDILPIKEATPIKQENEMLVETVDTKETETKETENPNIVDRIDFTNGNNKLSITFSKCHNRMFRIQIFLNDITELRPVTYTGATTGYAFWNMIKNILIK